MKLKTTKLTRRATLAGFITALTLMLGANQAGADAIALVNASFEKPAAGDNWYKESTLPASSDFGWDNNLGNYSLATKGAGHFTAAADGGQALLLGQGKFISQAVGSTAADTIYTLTFSLLQSKRAPTPGAAMKAEIFDGDHLLAARIFTVPSASNVWQTFTLTANSPHAPTGQLSVKFSGITAAANGVGAWIDNIALTTSIAPVGVNLANPSFETPIVSGGWWPTNLPASFGWSNNLGKYALAGKGGAGHFTKAAEGTQGVLLGRGAFISQTVGPTEAGKFYTLTFSLLQSKYSPNPGASLKAEIYDGEILRAADVFKVPAASDVWETFSITATPPPTPNGRLTVKFTGINGGSTNDLGVWLDNIILSTSTTAPAGSAGKAATRSKSSNAHVTIASYYFGQYHPNDPRNLKEHGKSWDEWELIKAAKPRFPGHLQPKVPLWGYTDESQPEAMAQKIAAAAEHGIDAFIFDWYHYDDGPFLDLPIDNGFLKATNNNRIKFAFMWANHDWQKTLFPYKKGAPRTVLYPGKVTPENFEKICDHVIKDYFSHPSYWKIDGKPYFSFYDLSKLMDNFGSVAATRAGLDKFRAKVKAAGFPGLHLNAVAWGQPILPGEKVPVDSAKLVRDLGFDSVTSYVWIHHVPLPKQQTDYNFVRDGYFKYWDRAEKKFSVPFFPNVSMGWDPSPRCDQSDTLDNSGYPFTHTIGNNTPENFRTALEMTKQRLLARPDSAGPRILNINCWNEWTEGSYLEPDTQNGMKYLEAVRAVFKPPTTAPPSAK